MLQFLRQYLSSEKGEIGDEPIETQAASDETGTSEPVQDADPFHPVTQDATDTGQTQAAATQGQEETFLTTSDLDPRKLPPELQPIFKRMQGVYTKRMQDMAAAREKAEIVDRFYGDEQFAKQTLIEWAARNGYQLAPLNGATQGTQQGQPGQQQAQPPPQLVEAFKANLTPELAWMAEPMAAAMGQSLQQLLSPVLQQQQVQQQQARIQEFEKYADDLRGVAPGWEEHEDTMTEIHEFFKSPQMFHPKFGSKIEMIYNLATSKAAAMKQATDRVNAAAKNRVSSGRTVSQQVSGQDAMLKANKQDAWQLAINAAKASLQKAS